MSGWEATISCTTTAGGDSIDDVDVGNSICDNAAAFCADSEC